MLIALFGTITRSHVAAARALVGEGANARVLEMDDCLLAGDRMMVHEDWVAAWEGWPYSASGLEASIGRMLESGQSDIAGQFNLIVFDRRRGELVALRDLCGSYSFYHTRSGSSLCLAPRVAEAEALLETRFALSLERLRAMHQRGEFAPPRSHYHSIELIEPDHIYRWTPGAAAPVISPNAHWTGTFCRNASRSEPESELLDRLGSLIQTSCRQAAADGDSVLQTSGGLDSNLLLHAQVAAGIDFKAMTFVFPGLDCDESTESRLSAERAGVSLDEVDLSGGRFDEYRDSLCEHCDVMPFTTTYFTTETVRYARRQGAQTILSGVGGDEIFWMPQDKAMGLLVRAAPLTAARHAHRSPRRFVRGLGRRLLSGPTWSLHRSLMQGNGVFYMAAAQESEWGGCSFRAPFRDAAVLTAVMPAACRASLDGPEVRGLQRRLLDHFAPALSDTVGVRKAEFSAVARATPVECAELGEPLRDNIAPLAPAFLEKKRALGALVVDENARIRLRQ